MFLRLNALLLSEKLTENASSTMLSNQFRHILVAAGLVEPRGHETTDKSRP